jgi:hypothetical protein
MKYNMLFGTFFLSLVSVVFVACGEDTTEQESTTSQALRALEPLNIDMKSDFALHNQAAYVTSQCYTKTEDVDGKIHNPCFTCHINSQEPNYIDDASLQSAYDFGEYTKVNHFINLFKDRTYLLSQISDTEIDTYVKKDNYFENGEIALAKKLTQLPSKWDRNSDGMWNGYVPDCYFNFDDAGFDKMPDGTYTLWRAFAYYPFLGTFWPTNGSTDDVLIRLHSDFTKDTEGNFDLEVYKLNLAIVEAMIKRKDIAIESVNESKYGVDLNHDGILSSASVVKYEWIKPTYDTATQRLRDFSMSYVGLAKEKLLLNEYLIAPGLYPKETEFLHTVRYLDILDDNSVAMAPRMKELRYAKKISWNNYGQLLNVVNAETKEKEASPDRLRQIDGNTEEGLFTGTGWVYQGFIEDENGSLRPQNYEETLYCIGCHSGIGATVDTTFVFPRKFDANSSMRGWYHWSQNSNGFKNISEPKTADGRDEYTLYLQANHAGDEFRSNSEVMERFFDANGFLKEAEVTQLKEDISYLLIPSVSRARALNKAYKIIVEEQSYIYGRDAHVETISEVHREVVPTTPTNVDVVVYE